MMTGSKHRPEAVKLINWLYHNRSFSYSGSESTSKVAFNSSEQVRKHLSSNKQKDILLIMRSFLSGVEYARTAPALAAEITKDYAAVFSILVIIGKEHTIRDFLPHKHLCDSYLPFSVEAGPPHDFPTDKEISFFEQFCEQQWRFIPMCFKGTWDEKVDERRVLPIIERTELGDGFARIRIHPDYDRLQKLPEGMSSNTYSPKTYVLKSYHDVSEEESYLNDIRSLIEVGKDSSVIGAYGSFKYRGSLYMILEYSKLGSLHEYYQVYPQSVAAKDLPSFWEQFLFLIQSQTVLAESSTLEIGTLNPTNILVSIDPTSSTGYSFKAANFGTSNLIAPLPHTQEHDILDHRWHPRGDPQTLQAEWHDMITSLAIILSEAVAWITGGIWALDEYSSRVAAGSHGGSLPQAPGDSITSHITRDLLPRMFDPDLICRIELTDVCETLAGLVTKAKGTVPQSDELAYSPVDQSYRVHEALGDPPSMTIDEAEAWRHQRKTIEKKSRKGYQLPGVTDPEFLAPLAGRDRILYIEKTYAMTHHWEELLDVIEPLVYIMKTIDQDEIGLQFYGEKLVRPTRNTAELLTVISARQSGYYDDVTMGVELGKFFGPYSKEINSRQSSRKLLPTISKLTSPGLKPLTIYVFTAGGWADYENVVQTLKDMSRFLVARGYERSQVGVQFISFGNDPALLKQLQDLNALPDEELDIMDLEPCNGNVWKMLLGSIDKRWDGNKPKHAAESGGIYFTDSSRTLGRRSSLESFASTIAPSISDSITPLTGGPAVGIARDGRSWASRLR